MKDMLVTQRDDRKEQKPFSKDSNSFIAFPIKDSES